MKKNKKYLIIIIVLIGILIVTNYGYTFAKYISNSIWNYYLGSKEFYMSSDFLSESNNFIINNNWQGENIHFNIKNNNNDILITEYDIDYNVTCNIIDNPNINCTLDGGSSNRTTGKLLTNGTCINEIDAVDVSHYNKTECELGGYKWKYVVRENDMFFDIPFDDVEDYVEVNIILESTKPFKKILEGTFKLYKNELNEDRINISYNNYSSYGTLVLSNTTMSDKCIKLIWDEEKVMIQDDIETKNLGYIITNLESKKNKSYIFYDLDLSQNYTEDEFIIEDSLECGS